MNDSEPDAAPGQVHRPRQPLVADVAALAVHVLRTRERLERRGHPAGSTPAGAELANCGNWAFGNTLDVSTNAAVWFWLFAESPPLSVAVNPLKAPLRPTDRERGPVGVTAAVVDVAVGTQPVLLEVVQQWEAGVLLRRGALALLLLERVVVVRAVLAARGTRRAARVEQFAAFVEVVADRQLEIESQFGWLCRGVGRPSRVMMSVARTLQHRSPG